MDQLSAENSEDSLHVSWALPLCTPLFSPVFCPINCSHIRPLESEVCLHSSGKLLGSSLVLPAFLWPENFLKQWFEQFVGISIFVAHLAGITVLYCSKSNVETIITNIQSNFSILKKIFLGGGWPGKMIGFYEYWASLVRTYRLKSRTRSAAVGVERKLCVVIFS